MTIPLYSVLVDATSHRPRYATERNFEVLLANPRSLNKNNLLYVPKFNTVLFMVYQSRLQKFDSAARPFNI